MRGMIFQSQFLCQAKIRGDVLDDSVFFSENDVKDSVDAVYKIDIFVSWQCGLPRLCHTAQCSEKLN